MSSTESRSTQQVLLVLGELLLVCMTVAAVSSFARLFVDNTWVRPLVAAALVAHLTVALVRRLGRGLLLSGVVSLVVMALQVTWTHYRDTTTAGLPTGDTRLALDADLTAAWNLFGEVKAPTEPAIGFLVIATFGIWVMAYLSDWAAFRLWSAFETLLPTFAVFVFVAFFGTDQNQYLYAALYLLAIVGFQLVHRLMRQSRDVRWLAGSQRSGVTALARTGVVVGAVAVLGAAIATPALPGVEDEAIIDLDPTSNGPSSRVVISPIVDIRGRIVDQPSLEAFQVRTETPSYWRLASLDKFDGQIWGADNKYTKASGDLPDDFATNTDIVTSTDQFEIVALDMVWVPAAFEAQRIVERPDADISYEPVSGTLIVGRDRSSSDGLTYAIESAIPQFDPGALAQAGDLYPVEIIERYTGLPDTFSDNARALAFELTSGATNDYDRAIALQDYFRGFEYDINVGAGHGTDRIDEFLASGRGYCEQFAGAFAAMARSIGMPARVAVGFTWGDQDPNDPNLYHVLGEHAHAWPEVYIPGNGWVAFEPTPTRGAPNSAQWTGVTPQQAGAGDTPETLPEQDPVEAPAPVIPPTFQDPSFDSGSQVDTAPVVDSGGGIPGWLGTIALALVSIAFLGAVYAAIVIGLKQRRRNRRPSSARGEPTVTVPQAQSPCATRVAHSSCGSPGRPRRRRRRPRATLRRSTARAGPPRASGWDPG